MKGISLLLVWLLPLYALPQSTFSQIYPKGQEGDYLKAIVAASPKEYAIITQSNFFRIDERGAILSQQDLHRGQTTFLESIAVDSKGNFYVVGQVFMPSAGADIVLFKLNSQGQLLFTKTITRGSPWLLKLVPAPNNQFYVAYTIAAGNDYVLNVVLLDEQGDTVWSKTVSDKNNSFFAAGKGLNGMLNIIYGSRGNSKTLWLQCDAAGNVLEEELFLPINPGSGLVSWGFCPTPDGGLAVVGEVTISPKLSNGILYKVAPNRQISWHKVIDIHQSDRFKYIEAMADGYIIAGESGVGADRSDIRTSDLVLVKTDLQGNVQWKRALGTAQADQCMGILVPDDQHFLVGARINHPNFTAAVGALFKTNRAGMLLTPPPFQLSMPAGLHRIQLNDTAPVQTLTSIVPATNGTYFGGANLQHADNDLVYPYLLKLEKDGQEIFHLISTTGPGVLKTVTKAKDGFFFALAEQKDMFGNFYTLVKVAPGGNTFWVANFGASTVQDMIGTSDGGCLLVGGEDISLSDFDLKMIKIDSNGNGAWDKKIGIPAQWEIGRRIIETPEHEFIIAGTTMQAFGAATQGTVIKINSKGDVIWSKTYSTGKAHSRFTDIVLTPDGYLLTGTAGTDKDRKDVWLLRLNKQGDPQWEKTYDLHLQDEGLSLIYAANDTIWVAGNTGEPVMGHRERFGFLMKLNKEGNRAGIQYLGEEGVQTSITKIWAEGNDLMLAGNKQEEYGKGYMFITKVSNVPSGEPEVQTGSALIVYPNPANTKAFLSMKNNYTGPVNIVLYNTLGQQVMALQRAKTSVELKEEVSLTGLSSGTYYFFIQHGSDKSVKKLEILNR
jgi:hypothetical protein